MSLPSNRLGAVAAASVLATGAAVTLNKQLGVSTDVKRLRRDRAFGKAVMQRMAQLGTRASVYHMLAQCDPDAEALWFEGRTYLYRDVVQASSQLAGLLQSQGVAAGHNVVVFMTNSPEMVFAFFAITQLGAVPAMINYSLRAETLAHVVKISNVKTAIATPDLASHLCEAVSDVKVLSLNLGAFSQAGGQHPSALQVDRLDLLKQMGRPVAAPRTVRDPGAIMYTSGTTGNPKAVSIKNAIFAVVATRMPEDSTAADRNTQRRSFACLPLFHGVGLNGGLLAGLAVSGCCCLVREFSASKFSQQLCETRATRMVYIGEICRYMLAAPPSKFDRSHACTVAWGNGLQKDVWNAFRTRFGVGDIREFYRSTEGQAKFENFLNLPGGEGKVGFLGSLAGWLEDDTFIVRLDDSGNLARDPRSGFCIEAGRGEAGEAIGRVRSLELLHEYLGDKKATESKLVRDVFAKGDLFQRSGDLLVRESSGWVRFSDRAGDTFRWTGENVSAGQIRAFILEMPQVKDAIVYGTQLTGYDGQAGCAAIVSREGSLQAEKDIISQLHAFLKSRGTIKAAIPRLVRFTEAVPSGPTFKHVKSGIANKSWDPDANHDGHRLYWLGNNGYEPLDSQAWSKIAAAKARL